MSTELDTDHTNVGRNLPVSILMQVAVTGVAFDGVNGAGLVDNGDGTWTATTPPHAGGPVDVVVSWTLNSVVQPAITHAGAFTYVSPNTAPTITDPADQSVTAGDDAVFAVEVEGTPSPAVVWEFSSDDGVTWGAVAAADGTVSGDGKLLTVSATEAQSGFLYRAVASNSVGVVTSAAATLTVAAVIGNEGNGGNGGNSGNGSDGGNDRAEGAETGSVGGNEKTLARTGSPAAPFIAAAALVTLAGAGLVLASRRRHT